MTRDEKVARLRHLMASEAEVQMMVAKVMRNNKVVTIGELAEKHPKQFNSILAAAETMIEEMPEPGFPWSVA